MARIPISRPIIGHAETESVARVLRSGMLASGPVVCEFEDAFASYIGTSDAVAVASGTAALLVGLLAAGIGPGDEVIVPSFTFSATANAVRLTGATPVFVDVDEATYCITPETVHSALTSKTRAVIPVHLYGHPAPVDELSTLLHELDIVIVEDAAQAHGAARHGTRVGDMGTFAAFSFYPTKNMTTGEGGMITTSDPAISSRSRIFRNQGMVERYKHQEVGLNERMTEIEAAIGLVQLANLPGWTNQRRRNAAIYNEALAESIVVPRVSEGAEHVYHQYTIRPPDRRRAIAALERRDVGYGIYYPVPVHLQDPYRDGLRLPVTERLADEVLSIPVRPDLADDELALVIETLNEAVQ